MDNDELVLKLKSVIIETKYLAEKEKFLREELFSRNLNDIDLKELSIKHNLLLFYKEMWVLKLNPKYKLLPDIKLLQGVKKVLAIKVKDE